MPHHNQTDFYRVNNLFRNFTISWSRKTLNKKHTMKKVIIVSAVALSTLSSINLNAQDQVAQSGDDAKRNFAGTWNVICATEVENKTTIKFCDLCTFKINPSNGGNTTISNPTMTFKGDSLTILNDNKKETISYQIYNEKHGLAFNYNNKAFIFRVFYQDKNLILTDQTGYAIVLSKSTPAPAAKPKPKKAAPKK